MRWRKGFQFALAAASVLAAALLLGAVVRPQLGGTPPDQAPAPSPEPTPQIPKHAPSEFLVMIDPSHGGEDKGAMFGRGKIAEKDIALALARVLKRQLEERGVTARLLRDSDIDLSLDRRATITNEEHPAVYVALHAGPPGWGVRVYTPALQPARATGKFLPWEDAQAASLQRSRVVARTVAHELSKIGLPVASLTSTLRPLNNLTSPAVAVEWVPGSAEVRPSQLLRFGNTLASAIASGIVQARNQGVDRP